MTCAEITELLLEGKTEEPGVKQHLAECTDCAATAELAARLALAGDSLRAEDLSADTVRATRQRVADILEARESVPLLRLPLLKPALAAAALLLIVSGVVLVLNNKKLPDHPTADELAMRQEITELRCSLMDRLGEFKRKYRTRGSASQFAVRRTSLRNRMNIVGFQLKRDLEPGATPIPIPAGDTDATGQTLNITPIQWRKYDEDTPRDETQGTRDRSDSGNTVAGTDGTGPGAQT